MIPDPSLSEQLTLAEARVLQTSFDLQQLETALYQTQLPAYYWPFSIQRLVTFVEARYYRAHRLYWRLQNASKSKTAASAPAPAAPPPRKYGRLHHQSADVEVVDGQTFTRIVDHKNDEMLKRGSFSDLDIFCRQISFAKRPVPEPYADILRRHNIKLDPPPRGAFLYYKPGDFLQLCRDEIEAGAQHFTEGKPYQVRALV